MTLRIPLSFFRTRQPDKLVQPPRAAAFKQLGARLPFADRKILGAFVNVLLVLDQLVLELLL